MNATEEEVAEMMDDNGGICYYKVLEWSLLGFEGESPLLFDWITELHGPSDQNKRLETLLL